MGQPRYIYGKTIGFLVSNIRCIVSPRRSVLIPHLGLRTHCSGNGSSAKVHECQDHCCQFERQQAARRGGESHSVLLVSMDADLIGNSTSLREPATRRVSQRHSILEMQRPKSRIELTDDSLGVLPEAYYSTNDAQSFNTFLSRCDILVASLPSTPQTQWMLKREHFGA